MVNNNTEKLDVFDTFSVLNLEGCQMITDAGNKILPIPTETNEDV